MKTKFNFSKWLQSRNGMISAISALLVLLVVVAFFTGSLNGLFGTAGLPDYSKPIRGYTCLPTCEESDGRMLIINGNNVESFAGNEIWIWVEVPGDATSFTFDIFDGDGGKTIPGAPWTANTYWDPGVVETTYTIYADQVQTGDTSTSIATWHSEDMESNKWTTHTINNVPEAKAPYGNYFYLLKAVRNAETKGWNAFKVRSSGFLSIGSSSLTDSSFGMIASWGSFADLKAYWPNATVDPKTGWPVSPTQLGTTPYSGVWNFKFFVPNKTTRIELWDGDFDRGTVKPEPVGDSHDPNAPAKPDFATASTVSERAGGQGSPADNSNNPVGRRGDSVIYTLTDPKGNPIYTNTNPSGTQEWERFVVSTASNDPDADLTANAIEPGFYNLAIVGLDISNSIYLRGLTICDEDEGCGDPPWGGSCPRTIGYWKNNFKKVLAGKPNGVQESKGSLNYGLKIVAKASKIFRGGLISGTTVNVTDRSDPNSENYSETPLTLNEGYTILMRGTGDKDVTYFFNLDRKTMLARALQQNLATWMNLGSGKLSGTAVVVIPLPDRPYEGSLLGALQEAEDLILAGDPASLERAKNIADYINNNQFSDDGGDKESAIEANPDSLACTTFNDPTKGSVPSDKQPPKIKDMPKAPKHEDPKDNPAGEPPTCTAGNTYTVENTTNNPFYSVKFNFTSGNEVKEGNADTFKYTLPADIVVSMTSMQIEVKAATDARTYDLACDFAGALSCEAAPDDAYSVTFDGATDNGNGTYTLAFTVTVFGEHGLSHVSFSLPEGQIAGNVNGNYTTESCVAP